MSVVVSSHPTPLKVRRSHEPSQEGATPGQREGQLLTSRRGPTEASGSRGPLDGAFRPSRPSRGLPSQGPPQGPQRRKTMKRLAVLVLLILLGGWRVAHAQNASGNITSAGATCTLTSTNCVFVNLT